MSEERFREVLIELNYLIKKLETVVQRCEGCNQLFPENEIDATEVSKGKYINTCIDCLLYCRICDKYYTKFSDDPDEPHCDYQ